MPIKNLIPWNADATLKSAETRTRTPSSPHREMNRLFDDVFRGFDFAPAGFGDRQLGGSFGWPNIELSEASNEVKVTAELPGLEEKDVDIHLADGVLTISGEKKTELEDKDRLFSERNTAGLNAAFPSTRSTSTR